MHFNLASNRATNYSVTVSMNNSWVSSLYMYDMYAKNVCFAMVSEKIISFFLYVPSGSDSSVRQRTSTASFYLCCSRYVTCICTVGGVHVYTVLHCIETRNRSTHRN